MKSTRMRLPADLSVWWLSAAMLWLSVSAWGQTTPSDNPPALKPTVTVERQGRWLVLNYKLLGPDGQPSPQNASNSRPEFTVHQGTRKVASGQFEYG